VAFIYRAYGLWLESNESIPGLIPTQSTEPVDVRIVFGSMPDWWAMTTRSDFQTWYTSSDLDDSREPALRIWKIRNGSFFLLRYRDNTEFIIDTAGTRIWASWPGSLTFEDTTTYLIGAVMGILLRMRGVLCFHSSGVAVGGLAVIFIGNAGAGKSTTAAAFGARGFSVLADDIVPLDEAEDRFWVRPAYPRLCLWPTSVRALFGATDALPRIVSTWEKRYLDLTNNGYRFQDQSLPLAAIYVLDRRSAEPEAPYVEAMSLNASLLDLLANTYANRLLEKEWRAEEFRILNRILDCVPVRRLTPHLDPIHLPRLCEIVLEDFHHLISRRAEEVQAPQIVIPQRTETTDA
jgi:hypothetical protein